MPTESAMERLGNLVRELPLGKRRSAYVAASDFYELGLTHGFLKSFMPRLVEYLQSIQRDHFACKMVEIQEEVEKKLAGEDKNVELLLEEAESVASLQRVAS